MSAAFEEMLPPRCDGTQPPTRRTGPRFAVVETEGYAIRRRVGGLSSASRPLLSCSVRDTALYGQPEVARFNQEDVRGWGYGVTAEEARESIRRRAAGLAAMLEAEHA